MEIITEDPVWSSLFDGPAMTQALGKLVTEKPVDFVGFDNVVEFYKTQQNDDNVVKAYKDLFINKLKLT